MDKKKIIALLMLNFLNLSLINCQFFNTPQITQEDIEDLDQDFDFANFEFDTELGFENLFASTDSLVPCEDFPAVDLTQTDLNQQKDLKPNSNNKNNINADNRVYYLVRVSNNSQNNLDDNNYEKKDNIAQNNLNNNCSEETNLAVDNTNYTLNTNSNISQNIANNLQALCNNIATYNLDNLNKFHNISVPSIINVYDANDNIGNLNSKRKEFKCTLCPFKFVTKQTLRDHIYKIHNISSTSCRIVGCGKILPEDELEEHEKTHNVHRCWISNCNDSFAYMVDLAKHIFYSHQGYDLYKCDSCNNMTFRTFALLCAHKQKKHELSPFICEICNSKQIDIKRLQAHIKNVHSRINYICHYPECFGKFTTQYNLEFHMKLHECNKKFVCPICNHAFAQKGNLERHVITHSKQYKCTKCNRKFCTTEDLSKHVNTPNCMKWLAMQAKNNKI